MCVFYLAVAMAQIYVLKNRSLSLSLSLPPLYEHTELAQVEYCCAFAVLRFISRAAASIWGPDINNNLHAKMMPMLIAL